MRERARSLPGGPWSGKKANNDQRLEPPGGLPAQIDDMALRNSQSLSRAVAILWGAYTVKLSPQPHSPFTLGLRKRNASLSPCLMKSTSVPSI